MGDRVVPPIAPVRVRSSGATHEGPARHANEDAYAIFDDDRAAIAVVADGTGGWASGRSSADVVIATCRELFEGRNATIVDELAEAWWKGEHDVSAEAESAKSKSTKSESAKKPTAEKVPASARTRQRPYDTLPIADRVQLRERVRSVLEKRSPESMGDVAVLETETRSLLALPERALRQANKTILKKGEQDRTWRSNGSSVVCVLFAGGQASIAHAGDCRVSRIRRTTGASGAIGEPVIEALTQEHTLQREVARGLSEITQAELADLPQNVVTQVVGFQEKLEVDTLVVPLIANDVFVLASDGFWKLFEPAEILKTVIERGVGAAAYMVALGARERPNHPGDNLTCVLVEILEADK